MQEWVAEAGIVRSTKEIELQRWIDARGKVRWELDISAYGQWWKERLGRKLDGYRLLRDRWSITWEFWSELCRTAPTIDERTGVRTEAISRQRKTAQGKTALTRYFLPFTKNEKP